MSDTSIEWTDKVWNCVRGCTRVSEGCRNCYAERMAARNLPEMRSPTTGKPFAVRTSGTARTAAGAIVRVRREARWTGAVELIPSKLDEPLRWRKPQRIFVNSMSDLFHESLSDEDIDQVFAVMTLAPAHTFQVLTKRPKRMLQYLTAMDEDGYRARQRIGLAASGITLEKLAKDHRSNVGMGCMVSGEKGREGELTVWPLPNVWLGTSVEDQATADERIPKLLQTPAAVRFISLEPQIAHVDLFAWATGHKGFTLDWVIQGGESGPDARPFSLSWARTTRDQCRAAGVAYFLKQVGSRPCLPSCADVACTHPDCDPGWLKLRDRKGGDPAEWPPGHWPREFPKVAA